MKKILWTVLVILSIGAPAFGMGQPQQHGVGEPLADDPAANLPPEIQLMLKVSNDVTEAAKKVEEGPGVEAVAKGVVMTGIGNLVFNNLADIWSGIKSAAGYVADTRIARAGNWLLTAPFDCTVGAAAQKTGLTASVANSDFMKNNSYYMATAGNGAYTAARYALGLATIYAAYCVYNYATTPASHKKKGINKRSLKKQQTLAQQSPRISAEPKAVPAQQEKVRFQGRIATPQTQSNQDADILQNKKLVEALCSDLRGSAKNLLEAIRKDLSGSTHNLLAKYGKALSSNMWLKCYGYNAAHKCTMSVAPQDSYCKQLILCLKGIDNGTMKRDEVLEKCVKPILNNITHIISSQSKK